MPSAPAAPNTLRVLQAMQYLIWTQVLVNGVSPFSAFSTDDQLAYGQNPCPTGTGSTITNAIYIGSPKDWDTGNKYPAQCHIIPPGAEDVERHAMGGKIWDIVEVPIVFAFNRKASWSSSMQQAIIARDQMYLLMLQHAELAGYTIAPTVAASHPGKAHAAYTIHEVVGQDWDIWMFLWWVRQEYDISGGIIP